MARVAYNQWVSLFSVPVSKTSDMWQQRAALYLRAALHPDVVGLWRDQGVQLSLIGPLSSVHRGDGQ